MDTKMIAVTIGGSIGALAGAFVLSRLLLWFLKRWDGGAQKVALVHFVCLLVRGVGSEYGSGADGANTVVYMISTYFLPQFIWVVFDLWRLQSRATTLAKKPA